MFLSPTTSDEIYKEICNLNSSKASDIYKFPINVIKESGDILSKPISIIINTSFKLGIFPDKLKLSKVTPPFKGGAKNDIKNYRPISVLPTFDKVFEKIMYKRIMSFLKQYNILHQNQFGFQKGKSTSHAILNLTIQIQRALKSKEKLLCNIFRSS